MVDDAASGTVDHGLLVQCTTELGPGGSTPLMEEEKKIREETEQARKQALADLLAVVPGAAAPNMDDPLTRLMTTLLQRATVVHSPRRASRRRAKARGRRERRLWNVGSISLSPWSSRVRFVVRTCSRSR